METRKNEARKAERDLFVSNLIKIGLSDSFLSLQYDKILSFIDDIEKEIALELGDKKAKISVQFDAERVEWYYNERKKEGREIDFCFSSYFLRAERYISITPEFSIDISETKEGYGYASFTSQLLEYSFISELKQEDSLGFSFILELAPFFEYVGSGCDISKLFSVKLPMWASYIDPKITLTPLL